MVVIKGMELPSCCNECPMYQSEDSDYCAITGEWITGEEMIRHKNCPLAEIITCKDCKHRVEASCLKKNCFVYEGFYCREGERKSTP